MANQDDNDEIEIQHRALIEEEEIDISELPKEIRSAMRNFNQKLAQYEESGEAKLFLELQQDDVAIANNILTFIEDEESEEEEEVEVGEEEEEEDVSAKPVQKKQQQPQQQAQQPQQNQPVANTSTASAQTATQSGQSEEEKVKASMKDGVISVEQLEKILNREPDYPYEQIGNLKLKKQYLRPFYEVA